MTTVYHRLFGRKIETNATLLTEETPLNLSKKEDSSVTVENGEIPSDSTDAFFWPPQNTTIQRYYKFETSALHPMLALRKRPHESANVTGLLRRTAVVPSHGLHQQWLLTSVGGRSGWAHRRSLQRINNFRAKDAWMGNHMFVCGCMLGSDAPSLAVTNILILVGYAGQVLLVLPALRDFQPTKWWENFNFIWWLTLLLFLLTMGFLWRTALTDPGIIPSVSSPIKPPIPQNLGGPLGYRYCSTCNIFRPPRSKHCNACNVCVELFDHHCPWTGSCIGIRNHAYFCWFLTTISLLAMVVTATVARVFYLQWRVDSLLTKQPVSALWETASKMPWMMLLGLFTLMVAYSLVSLWIYHMILISVGQTTNERVRGVYRYRRRANPADLGCWANWSRACCQPVSPSRLPDMYSTVTMVQKQGEFEIPADAAPQPSQSQAHESNASSLNDV